MARVEGRVEEDVGRGRPRSASGQKAARCDDHVQDKEHGEYAIRVRRQKKRAIKSETQDRLGGCQDRQAGHPTVAGDHFNSVTYLCHGSAIRGLRVLACKWFSGGPFNVFVMPTRLKFRNNLMLG